MRRVLFISMLTVMSGCAETRVVEQRGFITLRELHPGGLRPVRGEQEQQGGGFESVLMADSLPGRPDENDPLRRTMPDGTVRLYSFSPRQLIHHMLVTLANGEGALIDRWIVGETVKELYKVEGRDPGEVASYMIANAGDIIRLLKLVPLGESTPGAVFQDIGRNRYRLSPLGSEMLELRFHSIEIGIENGEFRLLTIQ